MFVGEKKKKVISCIVLYYRYEKVESQRYTLLHLNVMVNKYLPKLCLCCYAACVE